MCDSNPNRRTPVEVPLPKGSRSGAFLAVIVIILVCFGFEFVAMLVVKAPEFFGNYAWLLVAFLVNLFLFMPLYGIIGPIVETRRLKRVCTVRVKGKLVGYAEKYVDNYDRETRSGDSYYEYAPKYEIYINDRYEIRTINDFTRGKGDPRMLELLANPDGYEIIPADGKMSYSGRASIKSGIILLVIYVVIAVAGLIFFSPSLF